MYGFIYSIYVSLIYLVKHGFSFNIEKLSEEAVKQFNGKRTLIVLRLPSMIMGAISSAALYLLTVQITGNNLIGIMAALFLTLTPHFVIMTTLVTSDVGVSLFFTLSVGLLMVSQNSLYFLIGSAIFMGLTLGSKEPGVTLPVTVILFSLIFSFLNPLQLIIWLGVGALIFYLSWPLLWRNPIKVYLEHARAVTSMSSRPSAGKTYYLRHLFFSSPIILFVLYSVGFILIFSIGLSDSLYFIFIFWIFVPIFIMSLPKVPKRGGVSEILIAVPALSVIAAITVEKIMVISNLGFIIPVLVFGFLLIEILRFHPYYMNFHTILGGKKEIPAGWFGESMDKAMVFIDENAPLNSTIWIYGPKSTAYYYSNRVNTEKSLESEGLFQMRKQAGFDTSGAKTTTDPYFKQWKKGDLKFFFPYFHTKKYLGLDKDVLHSENVSHIVIINWAFADKLDSGNTAILEELRRNHKPVFTATFKQSEICWVYDVRNL